MPNLTNSLYLVPSVSCGERYIESNVFGGISRSGIQSSTGMILSILFPQKFTDDILTCLLSSLMYKNPIILRNGKVAKHRTAAPVKPATSKYLLFNKEIYGLFTYFKYLVDVPIYDAVKNALSDNTLAISKIPQPGIATEVPAM